MPKNDAAAAVEQPVATISLDEYCTRKSVSDKRVELLGAFYKTEVAAGRVVATESDFDARLVAFANQPA